MKMIIRKIRTCRREYRKLDQSIRATMGTALRHLTVIWHIRMRPGARQVLAYLFRRDAGGRVTQDAKAGSRKCL